MLMRSATADQTCELKRRWVMYQFVALAVTVGTVARLVVGRTGALIVAGAVLGLALSGWALLAFIDAHRRDPVRLDGARS